MNLERHVNNVRKYGLEPVVALNAFIHDTDQEIEFVKNWAQTNNVRLALTEVWEFPYFGQCQSHIICLCPIFNKFYFLISIMYKRIQGNYWF